MQFEEILEKVFSEKSLIAATLSGPKTGEISKLVIRPLMIQNKHVYQITEHHARKVLHRNVDSEECQRLIQDQLSIFKQAVFFTSDNDYHVLVNKSGKMTVLRKPPTRTLTVLQHNRQKNYLLEEGKPLPFLVALEIINENGKFHPGKRDKFLQINQFLEVIKDVLTEFDPNQPLHIVDFGCGKAYLTFALHYYLQEVLGKKVSIVGLDLKQEVIATCNRVTKELGLSDLIFQLGDISNYESHEPVDMVVVLHACNTATDAALAKAVQWKAKAILAAPCCQHELFDQIQSKELDALLRFGLLKERFASLVTDAARAAILEMKGYKVHILEFIDAEHTPKNLMIKALLQPSKERELHAKERFDLLKGALKFTCAAERLM